MERGRTARRAGRAVAAAVVVGTVVPTAVAGTGAGSAAAAAPAVVCTSGKAGLAAKLSADIAGALRGRTATVALSLRDRRTKTVCTLRADQRFDSASTVKVTVLATLLWDNKKHNRYLTSREVELATAMITKSDNAATTQLWRQLGVAKVKGFLKAAGMTRTVPGSNGYWGLTQITAGDEQRLLDLVTAKNSVLSDNSRAYILKLMNKVVTAQRWGTPAGAPRGVTVHVKNGWLPRATHGWRVHSLGAFTGSGHDYSLTVLTHDNRTMNAGVATIEAVARVVHRDLDPAATAAGTQSTTRTPQEAIPAVPPGT
ncbi:serine hydrolase [Actinacidiphila glaucinigra]|uniref:serine hydrolase n=1 Tax=Actinacidiphila glaucinigra TaxID=235986 RepID=UPI002DD85ADD|nr:serine hydrolase [Actinacidiphila glaucinigra]WSD60120.1 class A beta-lactamase-related serine hydrolase [Actinacidiphila glaucinigra]